MKRKIGFILFGHSDYENDIGLRMARKAVSNLRKEGIEVVFREKVVINPIMARDIALEILRKDVNGIILFLGTWTSPSTIMGALKEIDHLPLAAWAFPMFKQKGKQKSTGSLVALSVLKGTLERMTLKCKYILGTVDSREAVLETKSFAVVSTARKALRRARIGLVGYSAMGIYPGTFDHTLLRGIIGPEVEQLDTYILVEMAEKAKIEECEKIMEMFKSKSRIGKGVDQGMLIKAARIYVALRKIIKKHHLDVINVKCQPELSQIYGCVACLPLSLIADEGIVAACEGDVPVTVTMLMLHYLSDRTVTYGDILDIHDDQILLSSCGFAPFSLANNKDKIQINDIAHKGFKGPVCSFSLKQGRVTLARLTEGIGNYKMSLVTGEGVDTELRESRFPALEIRLDGDIKKFTETLKANHYALAYGDLTQELLELCKMLDIEPIMIEK